MGSWESVTIEGGEIDMMVHPSHSDEYAVGSRFGSHDQDGYVVLLQHGSTQWYHRPSDPRSVGVSDNGDVIFADWIEYGESTATKIAVFSETKSPVYQEHLDVSSPTVDINADGTLIGICPYGESARVIDIRQDVELGRHEYDIADRLIPEWITVDDGPRIAFYLNESDNPLYHVDTGGVITWRSDLFESLEYYTVITLDHSVSWTDVMQDFATAYADSSDQALKNTIANTIGEARLVDASPNKLREIVDAIEDVQTTFSETAAHEKLVSQVLGEAYYRLASDLRSGVAVADEFWQLIEQAANEYRTVLPWYEGKQGLSKTLRLQANQYAKQQRTEEALCCYEQIETLVARFDVELLSTGDTNRLEEYRAENVTTKDPTETGQLIRQTDLSTYE